MVYEEGEIGQRRPCAFNYKSLTPEEVANKTVDDENGKTSEPKKRGSKPLLVDEHKEFVENGVRENATVTLETY
ncbi:hypothetical protein G9P44_001111 [Scheffersomyces stipitis]|nr:hypothetical protein G9P44_001111 [Scheffersomyces stipitis]